MNNKHFKFKEESSQDFKDGYNKGRQDVALESLAIIAMGVVIWLVFL